MFSMKTEATSEFTQHSLCKRNEHFIFLTSVLDIENIILDRNKSNTINTFLHRNGFFSEAQNTNILNDTGKSVHFFVRF